MIFDCDGVLVETEELFNQTLVQDLAERGLNLTLEQCMGLFLGGTLSSAKPMIEEFGITLPDTWVEDFYMKAYDVLRENAEPIVGIKETLIQIEHAGIPYCVASNGRFEKMNITLGRAGLLDRFKDVMFSANSMENPKPAPDLFLAAASAFGIAPESCVVIEDSKTGVLAAKRAGMKCFRYAPMGAPAVLAAENAIPFDDMAKLPALLGIQ